MMHHQTELKQIMLYLAAVVFFGTQTLLGWSCPRELGLGSTDEVDPRAGPFAPPAVQYVIHLHSIKKEEQ